MSMVHDEMRVGDDVMVDAAAAFHEAAEPDIPQIEPPSPGHVTLMWGVEGPEGEDRQRRAEVRELNGADEEALARLDQQSASYYTDLVDTVCRRAVVSVGDIVISPANASSTLGGLLLADRDLLFKEVILATFGRERTYEDTLCPTCGAGNDIEVDVENIITVTELVGEPDVLVELRDGRKLRMHYPLGSDQKHVFDTEEDTTQAGYNTRMIARCVDAVDSSPIPAGAAHKFALDLGIADRRKVVSALAGGPAVKFKEVEVPCTECGEAIPFAFGWADLLWV